MTLTIHIQETTQKHHGSFGQSAYLWIQGAGARYLHVSDLCPVLEEARHVVERREDHDEDDEVSGANVEPADKDKMV